MSVPAKPRGNKRNKRNMRHIDQATRAGDGVLVSDQARLALVRDLRALLVDVIQALKDDPASPGAVEVPAAADTSILFLNADQV